ncbi:enoyl-CoA hydratase/isomerase family protein [Ammoniphilus sp. YIM 78166]|uniref:enoyl-CoA hydratase/isomerase family protein n=1 Tax=Ammoniphilus sp. YIM 78166 TaxID=1644106 RepID=UPI00106F4BF1|nr:enoyl-CoA hydratase/isomerase family protein [Ammoniphilus sp. YIM 78166]
MFQLIEKPTYWHIRINQDKGNSIDNHFIERFSHTLEQLPEDARVVIIEGNAHFSVGMNLQSLSHMSPPEVKAYFLRYETLLTQLEKAPFITIAKMTGYAMGAGAELALACDFRWMEQKAKVGFPGVNVGFTYNTKRLKKLIPHQLAKRLVLSGATINAKAASEYGIADRVLSHKRLDLDLEEFATQFAGKSPHALKYAKAAFFHMDPEEALDLSIETEHYLEGATAFMEGRAPRWTMEDKKEPLTPRPDTSKNGLMKKHSLNVDSKEKQDRTSKILSRFKSLDQESLKD